MIPEFPNFKIIDPSDKNEVEKFTKSFLPYSDFNFMNIWAWNVNDSGILSQLNGNLVLLLDDITPEQPFLSFIGKNKVSETALTLLDFCQTHSYANFLKYIPEEVIASLDPTMFAILTDKDSDDYVYAIPHLSGMDQWRQSGVAKEIKAFIKLYPQCIIKQYALSEIEKEDYLIMFQSWAKRAGNEDYFSMREYKAFERFLQFENPNVQVLSVYVGSSMIGFVMHEVVSKEYAVSHFAKANGAYRGIHRFLDWQEAKALSVKGVRYFNYEQDMGIPGLRQAKEKYQPELFLKKFIVKKI